MKLYDDFLETVREISVLRSISGLLHWDQETFLPPGGVASRAEQLHRLSGLIHRKATSQALRKKLEALSEKKHWGRLSPTQKANVREIRRGVERAAKIPASLVRETVKTTALAQHEWAKARQADDYKRFAPWLEKVLHLKRQTADCLGFNNRYDALLDGFEPEMRILKLRPLFVRLKSALVPLFQKTCEAHKGRPKTEWPGTFPVAAQKKLNEKLLEVIGFDRNRGRLDVTTHPFCMGMPSDVRLTTRYDEKNPLDAFYSTLHEAGHGLYEQGFAEEHFHTPMGEAVSMGIHESQSRLWENMVGRSRPFLKYFLGVFRDFFPGPFGNLSADDLFRRVNRVEPRLIRVESDEISYNLHILLRFEIEQSLLDGDLPVGEAPAVWNAKIKEMLGLTPPNNRLGILQDVHWATGAIGYFPTYTLGNLYAAEWRLQIRKALPDLDTAVARGDFRGLLEWLKANIHSKGMLYTAPELCQKITGHPLAETPFIAYLREKYEKESA